MDRPLLEFPKNTLEEGSEFSFLEGRNLCIIRHYIVKDNHYFRHRIDGPAVYSAVSHQVPQLWYLYDHLIHSGSKPPPDWEERVKFCIIEQVHEL